MDYLIRIFILIFMIGQSKKQFLYEYKLLLLSFTFIGEKGKLWAKKNGIQWGGILNTLKSWITSHGGRSMQTYGNTLLTCWEHTNKKLHPPTHTPPKKEKNEPFYLCMFLNCICIHFKNMVAPYFCLSWHPFYKAHHTYDGSKANIAKYFMTLGSQQLSNLH